MRIVHDIVWLDTGQTENPGPTSSASATGVPGTYPQVTHEANGWTILRTGDNNVTHIPPQRVVKCVETTVP